MIKAKVIKSLSTTKLVDAYNNHLSFSDDTCPVMVDSTIYPLVIMKDFLETEYYQNLKTILVDKETNIQFEHKQTDLYDFYQTKDLSNHPVICQLKDSLLADPFRCQLEKLIGKRLSKTRLDISSQKYTNGNYLLCHDDRLDKRRIAFVLYFVPKDWSNIQNGGQLTFLSTDFRGAPVNNNGQQFTPKENTFVCFQVSASSHHFVDQVYSNDNRISISGWFHDNENEEESVELMNKSDKNSKSLQQSPIIITDLKLLRNGQFEKDLCQYIKEIKRSFKSQDPTIKQIYLENESFLYKQNHSQEMIWINSLPEILLDKGSCNYYLSNPILKVYDTLDYKKATTLDDRDRLLVIIIYDNSKNNNNNHDDHNDDHADDELKITSKVLFIKAGKSDEIEKESLYHYLLAIIEINLY